MLEPQHHRQVYTFAAGVETLQKAIAAAAACPQGNQLNHKDSLGSTAMIPFPITNPVSSTTATHTSPYGEILRDQHYFCLKKGHYI